MFNEFHFQNSVLFLQALSCTFHVALDDGRYEFCPLLRFLFIYLFSPFNTRFHKAGFKQPAGMSGDSDRTSPTGAHACVVVSISCHFHTPVEFGHMCSPFLTAPPPPKHPIPHPAGSWISVSATKQQIEINLCNSELLFSAQI